MGLQSRNAAVKQKSFQKYIEVIMKNFLASSEHGKKRLSLDMAGIKVPIWILKGADRGKTLVVSAALHGDEYIGPLAIQRLFEEAQPEGMQGTVILLPLVNAAGFYAGSRLMTDTLEDLNQAFPGDPEGSPGARLAHAMSSLIYPLADFILDLHGGSIHEPMVPLVFYPAKADKKTSETAFSAAREMDVDFILASSASKGFYSCGAKQGVPGLLLEIGGEGGREEALVSRCLTSIKRVMAFLSIAYERRENPSVRCSDSSHYIEAKKDGLWHPRLYPGKPVKKGELLGEVKSLEGELLESIHARCDGIVWYYTKKLGVNEGTNLVSYGKISSGSPHRDLLSSEESDFQSERFPGCSP